MAAQPIPPILPPWARWLLQVAPLIPAGLQAVLDYIGEMDHAVSGTPDEWRRYVYHFSDSANIDVADEAVTTFDIVNVTGGSVDNSWTESDYTTVDTNLDGLVGSYCTHMCSAYAATRCEVYRMQFNPLPPSGTALADDKPFVKSGPPVRSRAVAFTSAASGRLPSQISMTATERTPYRKHWGRNYWPFPAGTTVDSTGHILAATVDDLAAQYNSYYGQLQSLEFFPVVPVAQIDKAPARGLLGVTGVAVDNVFDVQRRRRLKTTTRITESLAGEIKTRHRGGVLLETVESASVQADATA